MNGCYWIETQVHFLAPDGRWIQHVIHDVHGHAVYYVLPWNVGLDAPLSRKGVTRKDSKAF